MFVCLSSSISFALESGGLVCAHHKKQEAPFRGIEGVNKYLQINKYSNWGPKISIRVLSKVLSRAKKR